jgi:hypothetical protein
MRRFGRRLAERVRRAWRESDDRLWLALRRWWQGAQWYVVGALWLLAALLGYVGFHRLTVATGETRSPGDLFYLTLQLFVLESGSLAGPKGWELEVARLLAPAVAGYTAAQALAAVWTEQFQRVRLRYVHDHVVICGASRKGFILLKGFRQQGDPVVLIEADDDNDLLEQCRARGAVVLTGDATDRALLRRAAVHRARCLIAVTGDDATNAEIAMSARAQVSNGSERALQCIIHLVDPQLCSLLKERELLLEAGSAFRLELFNVFDRGARLLIQELLILEKASPECPPHLLVIGLGWLGESLVVRAAKAWRDRAGTAPSRLRVSIIDLAADWKCESLELRYPQLPSVCHLIPYQMDVRSPAFERGDFLTGDAGECDVDAVFVCVDDDSFNLHVGLVLLARTRQLDVPIFVRMAEDAGLSSLLRGGDGGGPTARPQGWERLRAFGLLDRTCTPELVVGGTHEILARAMHQDYLQHHLAADKPPETGPDLVPWEDLPEAKRESNRREVDHIAWMLEQIGCSITLLTDWEAASFRFFEEEINTMARLEHDRWCAELNAQGWRHAPGRRDDDKRTHPSLLPWAYLPPQAQEDTCERVRKLPVFLAEAGFQVYRRG